MIQDGFDSALSALRDVNAVPSNQTSPTTLSADQAAKVLLPALRRESPRDRDVVVTVADAAAHSGLSLREAESGLHALIARFHGHLSVTEQGTLLFKFARGLKTDWQRRGRVRAFFGRVGWGLVVLFRMLARMAITALLIGYAVVYLVLLTVGAVAVSIAAEDGSPLEGTLLLWWLIFELLADALYFTCHPGQSYDVDARARHRSEHGSSRRRRRHLYDKVNGLFIGVGREREDARAVERRLLALIRASHGVVGVSDIMRVTGQERAPAEATLSRLLLDHDGEVHVSQEGAVLYRFPALLETVDRAAERAPMPEAVWQRPVPVVPYTGNRFGTNLAIIAVTCFNGGMGWLGMQLGLPFYLAELPVALALGLLCLPILRVVPVWRARSRARKENGRRAMLAEALAAAGEARLAGHESLANAWRSRAGAAPSDTTVRALVLDLGGDIDAGIDAFTAPDHPDHASAGEPVGYRFADLEREMAALARARERAAERPEPSSAVVFSSDQ